MVTINTQAIIAALQVQYPQATLAQLQGMANDAAVQDSWQQLTFAAENYLLYGNLINN